LAFYPPIDSSCNDNLFRWLLQLTGQENKRIFIEGKSDTICWGHGFQTTSIDSTYKDTATLLQLLDTLCLGGETQFVEARLFNSGRLTCAYDKPQSNGLNHFDSTITDCRSTNCLDA